MGYNGNEAIVREAIYNDNIVRIQNHNKNGLSWNMSVNGFADLTEDEFLDMFTGISTPASHKDEPTFEPSPMEHVELMDSVDWVQRGKVNAIKDQGHCGSCWAFSAMGALESAYAIASGQLLSLAEQQLVDCDSSNTGCKGGWPSKAYDFLAKESAGVCSEASYSYTARDGNCHASSCTAAIPWGMV